MGPLPLGEYAYGIRHDSPYGILHWLGNRIYRVWEDLELPKYFLNLHKVVLQLRLSSVSII